MKNEVLLALRGLERIRRSHRTALARAQQLVDKSRSDEACALQENSRLAAVAESANQRVASIKEQVSLALSKLDTVTAQHSRSIRQLEEENDRLRQLTQSIRHT